MARAKVMEVLWCNGSTPSMDWEDSGSTPYITITSGSTNGRSTLSESVNVGPNPTLETRSDLRKGGEL